ncbi:ABC transporter permease [Fuchsiella alkaliacetigena]|uniref:ABC transporter permease n=1 Tax=Fuchsiella alkaliacetigena TaxID=957042 RepID=UPI00200B8623|nr:ABC transporter permease [Fuchsiella alkaliacetigena]MCK8824218.1 ABC transporter permease [Fuchsiella alkaliacetigena]
MKSKTGIMKVKDNFDIWDFVQKNSIWLIFVICIVFFSIMTPNFLRVRNITNIFLQSSFIGIMSIGMTYLMIDGNFDLSMGSIMALSAVLVIGFMDYGIPVAVLLSLLAGSAIGALNGLFVTKAGINAFIVTLGSMLGVRGLVYIYTGERALVSSELAFSEISAASVGPIPLPVLIFLIMLILGELVLRYTSHGRGCYAIGGNYEAAVNAGIKVDKHIIINFILAGFTAALAGILMASRMNAATPTLGMEDHMIVITAVVLGGTKLDGGFGNLIRTLGGVLVIGMIRNGMNLLNVHSYVNMLIMGLILISVVYMDQKFDPLEE